MAATMLRNFLATVLTLCFAASATAQVTFYGTDAQFHSLSCSTLTNGAASCSTDTTNANNISSGTLSGLRLPNPSASVLGGVQSGAAATHQFMTGIDTSGIPQFAQPAAADISGLGSLATLSSVNNGNWSGTALSLGNGGTNATLTASNGGIFYSTGSAGAILAGTATANQMLLSGAATTPAWSTATWPADVSAAGTVLNSSAAHTWTATAAPTLGVQQTAQGSLVLANTAAGAYSTTVKSSNSSTAGWTLTLPVSAGSNYYPLVTDGAGTTSWAQLALGSAVTGQLPLANGGLNANLTASLGGIFYSTGSAGAILSGTATAGQMLQSGASAAPAWSTASWPATAAKGTLLNASALNTIGATVTPILGDPGHTTGTLGFAGVTSGTATITPQSAAGTPTLTLPNASGTFAVTASSPLSLDTGTGNLTCSTCITTAGGQSIAGLTVTSSFTATGLVTLADIATQSNATLLGNISGSAASPSALTAAQLQPTLGAALVPHVATNTALKALTGGSVTTLVRDGYATAGDGGAAIYTWNASNCSLASGAGDDGSQVGPNSGGGCWLAAFRGNPDIRVWGAIPGQGSGVDVGPNIRAACAASATNGYTVNVPPGQYYLNTLDASGLGAIVIGNGSSLSASCSLRGTKTNDYSDTTTYDPVFTLGSALNRPLLYIRTYSVDTLWENIVLDGNRANQSGWSGGPGNKLYTVQIADWVSPTVDSSIRFDRVHIRNGYNGGLYLGSGRGTLWLRDCWILYNGQTTADTALYLNGYDATVYNMQIGANTGIGITANEGSQYQFTDGAVFLNGAAGMVITGNQVVYLTMTGTNFQANATNGISILSAAPLSGQIGGIHAFANVTFDGNSTAATNTYSDVLVSGSLLPRFTNPGFFGNMSSSGTVPKYNIEVSGTSKVFAANPSFGTGTAYGTAFTNDPTLLVTNANIEFTWTPALAGSTTPGSPTHAFQVGTWSRNGNEITARFSVHVTSLGTAAGNMTVTGLPLAMSATANQQGNCFISNYTGWTAASGFTTLSGLISPSTSYVLMAETGSGKTAQASPVTEYAASTYLYGVCHYNVDN